MSLSAADDKLTIISIAALADVLQDVLHEGLGHGVTAWWSGARWVTVSTVAQQSDISSRLIAADGTLVNLVFGGVFWLLLLRPQRYSPALRYFLVLAMTGNLFTGTGYFFFSGVTGFGDWQQVIAGQHPQWAWRLALVALGMASYYGSMLLVASKLRPFIPDDPGWRRLRGLAWLPYITDAMLSFFAGLPNPAGFFYVIASALPSTLGANAGLLSLPSIMRGWKRREAEAVPPIRRSAAWIAAAAVVCLVYIVVLGPGVTWRR